MEVADGVAGGRMKNEGRRGPGQRPGHGVYLFLEAAADRLVG